MTTIEQISTVCSCIAGAAVLFGLYRSARHIAAAARWATNTMVDILCKLGRGIHYGLGLKHVLAGDTDINDGLSIKHAYQKGLAESRLELYRALDAAKRCGDTETLQAIERANERIERLVYHPPENEYKGLLFWIGGMHLLAALAVGGYGGAEPVAWTLGVTTFVILFLGGLRIQTEDTK